MSTDLASEEFCPNCGSWVDALDEETGWCRACIGVVPASLGVVCPRCGLAKDPAQFTHKSNKSRACRACQTAAKAAWRVEHLDHARAYDSARGRMLGTGKCPTCGRRGLRLTAKGLLSKHRTNRHARGAERCEWQGAPA